MFRLCLLLVLVVLVGCASPGLEVASITDVRSSTGSRGIDVYEPKRRVGSAVPEFAGDQVVEVRTYKNTDEGQVEIAGATCSLSATGFSASMRTPAKVRVPLYREQSSTLAVTCEMPGYQKRMVTVAPYDATRQSRLASSGSGGLIGVLVVAAVDAMADNSKNDWRYPPARVQLEPNASGKVTAQR
jgi:hypothetical protein